MAGLLSPVRFAGAQLPGQEGALAGLKLYSAAKEPRPGNLRLWDSGLCCDVAGAPSPSLLWAGGEAGVCCSAPLSSLLLILVILSTPA